MIIDIKDFDYTKTNIHDPYETDNNVKIDISLDKLKPVMVRLENLHVLSFTDNLLVLDLREKEDIKEIFDKMDTHIVSVLQDRRITKRFKTKFNYRQLTSTYTNKNTNYNILSLNVLFNGENYNTEIYESKNKELTYEQSLLLLKDNANVSLILEITGILFNINEGVIHLENIVRQMKVKKIKPKRIEKLEYSFVDTISDSTDSDSDSDSDSYNNTDNEIKSISEFLFNNDKDNDKDKDVDNRRDYNIMSENNSDKYLKTDDDCLLDNSNNNSDMDNNTSDNID